MRAIFRYPGSKWRLAEWIIEHFPPDYEKMIYLEPFVGFGAVFFNKRPSGVETINDLESEIVNVFAVLRDQPEELKRKLELTPYSREEYDLAFEPCEDSVERARRYFVRTTQAIGAKMNTRCGWRNHKTLKIGGTACKWGNITDTIDEAVTRLRGSTTNLVQIEHMDALRLIEKYDSPDVLMYLDPPYVRSARKSGRMYNFEMDDLQQENFLDLILKSKAKIVLSGYSCDLYDSKLAGWHKDTAASQITSGEFVEEVVWTNFKQYNQMSLFEKI